MGVTHVWAKKGGQLSASAKHTSRLSSKGFNLSTCLAKKAPNTRNTPLRKSHHHEENGFGWLQASQPSWIATLCHSRPSQLHVEGGDLLLPCRPKQQQIRINLWGASEFASAGRGFRGRNCYASSGTIFFCHASAFILALHIYIYVYLYYRYMGTFLLRGPPNKVVSLWFRVLKRNIYIYKYPQKVFGGTIYVFFF